MTKQEFLDRLRRSLHGKITPGQIVENLQFYEDYINTEIRMAACGVFDHSVGSERGIFAPCGNPSDPASGLNHCICREGVSGLASLAGKRYPGNLTKKHKLSA